MYFCAWHVCISGSPCMHCTFTRKLCIAIHGMFIYLVLHVCTLHSLVHFVLPCMACLYIWFSMYALHIHPYTLYCHAWHVYISGSPCIHCTFTRKLCIAMHGMFIYLVLHVCTTHSLVHFVLPCMACLYIRFSMYTLYIHL